MKWFKHDGNALSDPKIEKLIMKYGIEGYGLYFACVEIIAGNLATDNITFELEHDAEILAYKFKIDTLKVEDMMKYMVQLGLLQFNNINGRIICNKLAKRLDNTMSQNAEMKKLIESKEFKETLSNFKKLEESKSTREENRREDNTREEKKEKSGAKAPIHKPLIKKKKYREYVSLKEDEYNKLLDQFGGEQVARLLDKLDNHKGANGKMYKDDYRAILNWVIDACKVEKKPKVKVYDDKINYLEIGK